MNLQMSDPREVLELSAHELHPLEELSAMLLEVKRHRQMSAEFCIPPGKLGNEGDIRERIQQAPEESRSALKTTLSYLYLEAGPINLSTRQFSVAEPFLLPSETILAKYLKSKTTGPKRPAYGGTALSHARSVGYKCQCCDYADVRVLNLDHAHGRAAQSFLLLCANCHNLKSRRYDWHGRAKRVLG